MQETPKNKEAAEKKDTDEISSGDDRNESEYYYDDAHGYEAFDPDVEEDEEDQVIS